MDSSITRCGRCEFSGIGRRSPGEAASGGPRSGNISIETVVEFGNTVQPVVVNESSAINIARIVEVGVTGSVDATVVQTGIQNYVSVVQIGSTTNALIAQSGQNNIASISQMGNINNSLLREIGSMNTGTVRQFGGFNWSGIFNSDDELATWIRSP